MCNTIGSIRQYARDNCLRTVLARHADKADRFRMCAAINNKKQKEYFESPAMYNLTKGFLRKISCPFLTRRQEVRSSF